MHSTWHSKPERLLRELVQKFDFDFIANQRLHDKLITSKSHRKQVDLMNHNLGIVIEFDGVYHFKAIKGEQTLEETKKRDAELDAAIIRQELTLIRISYDQFSYKDGGKFSDDCLKQLFELLRNPNPGVHYIGNAYNKHQGIDVVSI